MGAITKLAAESGDMVIRVVGNTDTELQCYQRGSRNPPPPNPVAF